MHDLNMNYPVQCVWFGGLMAVNLTPYPLTGLLCSSSFNPLTPKEPYKAT